MLPLNINSSEDISKNTKDARGASFFIVSMREGGAGTNFAKPCKRGGRQVERVRHLALHRPSETVSHHYSARRGSRRAFTG